MIKVGITGQPGFVGTHLFNTLGLYSDKFIRIQFEDTFFQDEAKLKTFVSECDVIVHLAAMNRHYDLQVLYRTNIGLVKQLITACEATKSTPHILFSSSTQENSDNLYGKSKKEGRELLEKWAEKNHTKFTGFVIPNVFGPFGQPYYNSVVATFCHQLTHKEQPKIDVDDEIKLIYISELVEYFIKAIKDHSVSPFFNTEYSCVEHCETTINPVKHKETISSSKTPFYNVIHCETIHISHTTKIKVSALLQKLNEFKENYFEKGIIPDLNNPFDRNLFNTFLCYIDISTFFPFKLKLNTDERGSFVETIKLNSGGQVSFSITVPGITRGNHFHTRKAERFAIIKGKARIELRRIGTNQIQYFELDGKEPSFVDIPIWFTHNITNIGKEELYTIFWINEHFDSNDPDTWLEKV